MRMPGGGQNFCAHAKGGGAEKIGDRQSQTDGLPLLVKKTIAPLPGRRTFCLWGGAEFFGMVKDGEPVWFSWP